MISVVTWNMDNWKRSSEQRKSAWDYLTKVIQPVIALLQECVPPEDLGDEYYICYQEIAAIETGVRQCYRVGSRYKK